MWWNGWVFSFEKDPKSTNISDGESSGMDEAINCLDNDFDMQVLDQQEFELQEDLIETFDSLTVSMAQAEHRLGESSSGSSRVQVPPSLNQPAQPGVSSFAPGPSHTHSVKQQDITMPEIVQPMEEEISSQNSKGKARKGKEKDVDNITKVDTQVKKAVAGGKQRGRPKKMAN